MFVNEKLCILIKNFTEVCSLGCNWKWYRIGLDNGLAQNRRQAIIWPNADMIYWCTYAALGGDELTISVLWFLVFILIISLIIIWNFTQDHDGVLRTVAYWCFKHQRTWLSLVQVMVWCSTAPSHYLCQWWYIIKEDHHKYISMNSDF